jgi:hypothetical protein
VPAGGRYCLGKVISCRVLKAYLLMPMFLRVFSMRQPSLRMQSSAIRQIVLGHQDVALLQGHRHTSPVLSALAAREPNKSHFSVSSILKYPTILDFLHPKCPFEMLVE